MANKTWIPRGSHCPIFPSQRPSLHRRRSQSTRTPRRTQRITNPQPGWRRSRCPRSNLCVLRKHCLLRNSLWIPLDPAVRFRGRQDLWAGKAKRGVGGAGSVFKLYTLQDCRLPVFSCGVNVPLDGHLLVPTLIPPRSLRSWPTWPNGCPFYGVFTVWPDRSPDPAVQLSGAWFDRANLGVV